MAIKAPTASPGVTTPAISLADLTRFLKSRKVKAECHKCGENKWSALGLTGVSIPALVLLGNEGVLTATSFPLVALVCDNCGNVNIIARTVILEWIKTDKDLAPQEK